MRQVGHLTVGWANTSIDKVIAGGTLSRFSSVLLTSIDSTIDLPKSTVGQRIVAFDSTCEFFGQGVLMSGKLVSRIAVTMDLFNGFDELWCFEQRLKIPKPNNLWIVSPLNFDSDPLPPDLSSWMAATDCSLGLGDGIGLNFAAAEKGLASFIQGLSE